MFSIGQRVVCIRDFRGQGYGDFRWPDHIRRDGVYVVRKAFYICDVTPCLYLNEFVGPFDKAHGREIPFLADWFRPVIEKKTDISIFTSLLNTKQREHEFTL